MKKKKRIILAVVFLIIAIACACVAVSMMPKSTGNPSRRDDAQIAGAGDEDLAAVTGDEQPKTEQEASVDKTPALTESVVQQNVNKPLSDDVEVVSRISLNEAVVMGESDIGTFYSDEEFKDVTPVFFVSS